MIKAVIVDDEPLARDLLEVILSDIESVEVAAICSCLLYTSPSPRDRTRSRMPSSA